MAKDPSAIYTRAWFDQDFTGLQTEFKLVAQGIDRLAESRGIPDRMGATALDVGCGPGMLVAELDECGWEATGFDGSSHALDFAREHVPGGVSSIRHANILDDPPYPPVTLVVCTEVAEHLEEKHAAILVQYLVKHASGLIVFTAAPPGQGGHDHVNEQPKGYWLELFAEHGWIEDVDGTNELKARWSRLQRLSHMTRNVMVLR